MANSLRPAWRNQSGGRGFQPPPSVMSAEAAAHNNNNSTNSHHHNPHHHHHNNARGRSQSVSSSGDNSGGEHRTSTFNKFAALDDDDDVVAAAVAVAAAETANAVPPSSIATTTASQINNNSNNPNNKANNSRSEALRASTRGSVSGGNKAGRRLADLAAHAPPERPRYSTTGPPPPSGGPSSSSSDSHIYLQSSQQQPSQQKVIRFTRERLMAMRPTPSSTLPTVLAEFQASSGGPEAPAVQAVLSEQAQDPVCWDTFDHVDDIWATVPLKRSSLVPGKPGGPRSLSDMAAGTSDPRTRRESGSSAGRWQRGVALPPPSAATDASKRGATRGGARGATNESHSLSDLAENPNDLWDDPIQAAAGDFSAFGDTDAALEKDEETTPSGGNIAAFDFEKMAEESRLLEEELHGSSSAASERRSRAPSDASSGAGGSTGSSHNNNGLHTIPAVKSVTVDSHRPLASVGTTIRSGSGDNVNVFEDFDEPLSSDSTATPTAVDPESAHKVEEVPLNKDEPQDKTDTKEGNKEEEAGDTLPSSNNNNSGGGLSEGVGVPQDVDATSRLMAMIGVPSPNKAPVVAPTSAAAEEPESTKTEAATTTQSLSSAWGLPTGSSPQSADGKPIDGLPLSMNPWGTGPLLGDSLLAPTNHQNQSKGLDLQARLREADLQQQQQEQEQQKAQEEELLARQRRQQQQQQQQEAEREAQKRAAELQQQQQQRQQAAARQQQQQQQQQQGVQSQVELVLMERISNILENSWGRSDLMSVLSTLHAEDSRVIPLLNTIDALRALILRHSTRVALRHDQAFGAEMAVLLVTNAQWQQQQQQQQQQSQQQQQQQQQEALNRQRQQQQQQQQEEELRRAREQQERQRRLEEEQAAAAAAEVLRKQQQEQQQRAAAAATVKPIVPGAPWFYSDPQQNIQGPFRGEEMRQWLEAGYFKGDLPVSQESGGPFRPLSTIYPDLSVAFMTTGATTASESSKAVLEQQQQEEEAAAAAEEEARIRAELETKKKQQQQREAEERAAREAAQAQQKQQQERRAREAAAAQQEQLAREAAERERLLIEQQQQAEAAAAAEEQQQQSSSNGGNESSTQLKMMLGLSAQQQAQIQQQQQQQQLMNEAPKPTQTKRASAKPKKSAVVPVKAPEAPPPVMAPKPAAPAWGAATSQKPASRKSMSEIQQEEARLAAMQAMQRERAGPSNSGWANVAASKNVPQGGGGSSGGGWNSAAAKLTPTVVVSKQQQQQQHQSMPKPTQVRKQVSAPNTAATSHRAQVANVAPVNSQTATSKPQQQPQGSVDEFGASMSPALEKWCKEQMVKLTGTDDLTLVSFCMTLNDPNEIRQYLVTYLGPSPQVNNFASEFIHRKMGINKPVKEEWETSGKKKGKKKVAGR